jgi:hypothetical protein
MGRAAAAHHDLQLAQGPEPARVQAAASEGLPGRHSPDFFHLMTAAGQQD